MEKMIKLYTNTTKEKARFLAKKIEETAQYLGYGIVNPNYTGKINPDIVIGLGGDGTLLNFLQENNYKTSAKYIGVNCGTLGFLQDFEIDDVKDFINNIPNYIEQKLNFVSLDVNDGQSKFNALNEFSIQNENDKAFRTSVYIDDKHLEDFIGTGLIFSTPTGSTARNLSSVGCIVHPDIEALQITPREAIVNNKMHSLAKSICIPKSLQITLYPANADTIKIYSDGKCVYIGLYSKININYSYDYIIKLTDTKNSFIKKVREKLIV